MNEPVAKDTEQPGRAREVRRAALSGLVCAPCVLANLIVLGTFAAIGSAVNGAWVATGVFAAAAIAVVIVRRRVRSKAMAGGTGC